MKKTVNTLLGGTLLVFFVIFSSCNEINKNNNTLLVGKWKYYAFANLAYADGWQIVDNNNVYIQFNSNGSCNINGWKYKNLENPTKPTKWEIVGDHELLVEKGKWNGIKFTGDPHNDDFVWSVNFLRKSEADDQYFPHYYYYPDKNGLDIPYDYDVDFQFDYPDILFISTENFCQYLMFIRVK